MATPTLQPPHIRLLHISDTHLFGDGSLHRGVIDTTERLNTVLHHAQKGEPCAAIIVSGDISDDGTVESYRLAEEKIGALARTWKAPVVWACGNHDARRGMRQAFAFPGMPDDPILSIAEIPDLRIIAVDTSVPGKGYGYLGQQIQWAIEAQADNRANVFVLHHPPLPAPTLLHEALRLSDTDELADALENIRPENGMPKPVAIIAGHYHRATQGTVGGVPVFVAPGVANITVLDRGYEWESSVAGSGYEIVTLSPSPDSPLQASCSAVVYETHVAEGATEVFHFTPEQTRAIGREAGRPGWNPDCHQ
ncbi:metallophosphoesterase [Actinotignum urinale]|uniref:metallophosphoesterase n=1 Tax=Actinotignum urinale TaxID=190146 RepID=UPI000C80DE59|nr:metallophosphoesterase [Actinotignum urinale]WIK59278.1 metallophosphoesterase [Actinotignum urinale]